MNIKELLNKKKEEYCTKFGLCLSNETVGKCNCKQELKFIDQIVIALLQGEIEYLKSQKKEIGHILVCKMCSPNCGYNQAIDDQITHLLLVIEEIKNYYHHQLINSS